MTRTLAALVVAALAVGACGNGDTAEEQTEAAPAPTATVAPQPTETATEVSETETEQPREQTYRVQRGDTLSEIAQRFDTTVRAIARLNDIEDPHAIRAGQRLKIPAGE